MTPARLNFAHGTLTLNKGGQKGRGGLKRGHFLSEALKINSDKKKTRARVLSEKQVHEKFYKTEKAFEIKNKRGMVDSK